MSIVTKIAKNTLVSLASQILSITLGFFYLMYTARYLGIERYGILTFALAFAGMFGIFLELGLSTLTTREVSRNKTLASKYVGNISFLKIILFIITLAIISVFVNILGYPEKTIEVVYIVTVSGFLTAFTQIFYSIFQAFEKMEYQSISNIVNSTLMLSGALFAIKNGYDVVEFAYLYCVVNAIILIFNLGIYTSKITSFKIEFDRKFLKYTIKETWYFALTGVAITINQRVDRIMLSLMVGMSSVGIYSAASNLVLYLEFLPAAYIMAIYPVTSRLYSSKKDLEYMLQRSAKYMLILGFPIGVGTTLLAEKIIILIYGQEFILSTNVLKILIWSEVIIFVAALFNNLLISINKQALVTKQIVSIAIINIAMNLILIPKYSYIGASAATLISSIAGSIFLYYYLIKNDISLNFDFIISGIKIIISSLLMGVYINLMYETNIFFLLTSSALVYFMLLSLTKIFDSIDFGYVNEIILGR